MKHAWHRQVRTLVAIGVAGASFLAVAAAPAYAHPPKPASATGAGHLLRMPVRHGAKAAVVSTVTVTGVLEKVDGTPFTGGADIWWNTSDSSDGSYLPVVTDGAGAFTLANVDAVTDGQITVGYPDGTYLLFANQDFTAGSSLVLQPGLIGVTVANWTHTSLADLWGGTLDLAWASVAPSDTMLAPPSTIDRACIYLDSSDAVEWQGSATVVAGATSATSIDVDANDSRGVRTLGWASGAAGSKVSYAMRNWTGGYQVAIVGWSEYKNAAEALFSLGTPPVNVTRTFVVPKTAPAGYPYEIHAQKVADDATTNGLDVFDCYQVCSFKSSSWSIRRGQGIVLSGVVPTTTVARMGMHPGPRKAMFVFSRTKASGQPATWLATGWSKAAKVTCSTSGYFKTAVLHPRRTTWYVVRYPGDGWNWRAFTQVIKVTVR